MPQALQQFFHQLLAAFAAEGFAVLDQHFAGEAEQCFAKPAARS
jgi:hypothetical protein